MDIKPDWWLDERCHFGKLNFEDKYIQDRSNLSTAIEFINNLADDTNRNLLDLCCGPGKYSVDLSMKGFDVIGIDLNKKYLDIGRKLAQQHNVNIQFINKDMREIPYKNKFHIILNLGTSFGYFDNDSDDLKVLHSIAEALCLNGLLVLEMGNRKFFNKHFLEHDRKTISEVEYLDLDREWIDSKHRIKTCYKRYKNDKVVEEWGHSWRAYSVADLETMLNKAGFEIQKCFGGWDETELNSDKPQMVLVAKLIE